MVGILVSTPWRTGKESARLDLPHEDGAGVLVYAQYLKDRTVIPLCQKIFEPMKMSVKSGLVS